MDSRVSVRSPGSGSPLRYRVRMHAEMPHLRMHNNITASHSDLCVLLLRLWCLACRRGSLEENESTVAYCGSSATTTNGSFTERRLLYFWPWRGEDFSASPSWKFSIIINSLHISPLVAQGGKYAFWFRNAGILDCREEAGRGKKQQTCLPPPRNRTRRLSGTGWWWMKMTVLNNFLVSRAVNSNKCGVAAGVWRAWAAFSRPCGWNAHVPGSRCCKEPSQHWGHRQISFELLP